VSCHHGWTLHMAFGQPKESKARLAFAVSYFADGARVHDWAHDKSLRADMQHSEDKESYEGWLHLIPSGARAAHPCIPIAGRPQARQLRSASKRDRSP
jgi:hypothetical protein